MNFVSLCSTACQRASVALSFAFKPAAEAHNTWRHCIPCLRQASTISEAVSSNKLRNFAIIAHVDHGKTTLMDKLLYHDDNNLGDQVQRAMDSGQFEKERGITITSKYTSFQYGDYTLNAVDTPGHADFGGEVERVLGMVDGALLVVDVTEGAMAQTKFVLGKALDLNLRPIVVFNKVDRPTATSERCDLVHGELLDLFEALGASEDQMDFPVLYASGKGGWASTEYPEGAGKDIVPVLDAITRYVPPPKPQMTAERFSMLVTMISHDNFLGRVATGRIASGHIEEGAAIKLLPSDPSATEEVVGKVTRILKRRGVEGVVACAAANTGDIISLTGLPASIGDTICDPELDYRLEPGQIDPPTLSMVFSPNSSPLGRGAGNVVTAQKIMERLQAEAATSVSLRVKQVAGTEGAESIQVQARGELQLGLLIEGMRRDNYELEISAPQVLMQIEGGKQLEPVEEVSVEVPSFATGDIIETLNLRKGQLQDMNDLPTGDRTKLIFHVPTRGMIGYKGVFTALTKGEGILSQAFLEYRPYMGPLDKVRKGVLVSMASGSTTAYALSDLQARGTLFVAEGEKVYSGMIIGESSTEIDLEVNPTREKKLSNVRSKGAEDKNYVAAPRVLSLEETIGYIQPDELIEVMPSAIRIRKANLSASERRKLRSRADGG